MRYGGVVALRNVSLKVEAGSIVGLIGPNGAGKTTLLDAITGFARCSGRIEMDGSVISDTVAHRRVHRGLSRTFQSLELFEDLTVRDNLLVSADPGRWWSIFVDVIRPGRRIAEDAVDEALGLLGLAECADSLPPTLSHGQRKLVGVARAMASRPRALLLDEPAAGLDSAESTLFGEELRRLVAARDVGVLLVDHDMGLVLNVCDYIYVLNFGQVIAEGTPASIRQDTDVVAAYLGEQAEGPDAGAIAAARRGDATGRQVVVTPALEPVAGHPASARRPGLNEGSRKPALVVQHLVTGYSGVPVVRDVSLSVSRGEVVALFGPNGAGKTTTLLTISGLVEPISGSIEIEGQECAGVAPHVLARRGLAHVPEDRGIVPSLSVRENLALVRKHNRRQVLGVVTSYFPALEGLLDRRASTLSGGEQQMLAIALALATSPKVLMVDEMSLGLAPVIVERLLPIMRAIANDTDTAVLLVEQHVHLALEMSDRTYVLSHGELVLEGQSADLSSNRELLESSYLGTRAL
ncbi:MAG: ATP-binding cassette domain-containing protein [Actinomycetota bacterium]|nr:ATP-binding cassette domain-containing protein [Actinomycetota bacterium]